MGPLRTAVLTLLLVTYIGSMYLPYQFSMSVVFIMPVCLLITWMASDDLKNRSTPLNRKMSVWLGETSCSFQRGHFLVLFYFLNLTAGKQFDLPQGVALIAVVLILSVSYAGFLYGYSEAPMMKFILDKLVILSESA